jgi:hypothetical protein
MLKLIVFIFLVMLNHLTYSKECDPTRQTAILLNSNYIEPTNCTISPAILKSIEYHHALGYGKTKRAEELLDSWLYDILEFDTTFSKIYILNLHGKYEEALSRLETVSSDLKTKEQTSYLIALAQTHLKLGNIVKAEKYFKSIHKTEFINQPEIEFQYELIKYELLSHHNNYPRLLKQSDNYLAKLMNNKGTGNGGYDLLVVSYALLAICKTAVNVSESKQKLYLRASINDIYSESSVFHNKLDRIIDRCE